MPVKFDQQKTKHQLFHLSISLATVLICMVYLEYRRNWMHLGKFWNSLVLPIVFVGEISKVVLAQYYDRIDNHNVPSKTRQKRTLYSTSGKILKLFYDLFFQLLITLLYAFICIILGAPVLKNFEQTFVLALLLTLLTVSPTVFLLGGKGALQVCFCEKPDFVTKSECTALDLFKCNALGGVLGAWAGSIVAPLDWDRDWQEYPVPNVVGALLGSAFSDIYACSRVLYATARIYINKKCS